MKISLDLLPQNKKDAIKRKKLFKEIVRQELLFIFPLLVLLAILGNIYYLLKIQKETDFNAYALEEGQDRYKELKKYDEDFKNINESSSFLLKIEKSHLNWSNSFKHLGEDVPDGITVDNFITKNFKVSLAGKSKTRDKLIEFKNNLESDSCFADVNVPLSNLVVKDDVDFQIDFSVNKDCLLGEIK